jgi:hypothetical protein
LVLISVLAIVVLGMTPALARYSPVKVAAKAAASHDQKPGPAWRTFNGTTKTIEDNSYTGEDYEGNHVKLYNGPGTNYIKQKRVGNTVHAEIIRGGFANSIQ